MDPARPLRSVFAELTGGRGFADSSGMSGDEVLAAHGHPDLPEGLVAEAVVSYADTAPVEVAEHLAPYVRANTAVPQTGEATGGPEPHWYDLLTTAPMVAGLGHHDVLDAEASALAAGGGASIEAETPVASASEDIDDGFGHGHRGPAEEPTPGSEPGESAPGSWVATTGPVFEGDDLDTGGPGIDLRSPIEDAGAMPGDEPDAVDGV